MSYLDMMDAIEFLGKLVSLLGSWAVGGCIGGLIFTIIRKQAESRHEHQVAAYMFAENAKPTRQGIKTGLDRTQVNAALLRLCTRGLVERKFVGNCDVPYFELTPDGATIMADDS